MPRTSDHAAAVEAICSVNIEYASMPEEVRAEMRETISIIGDAIIEANFVRNTEITDVDDLDSLPLGSLIFVPDNSMFGHVFIRHSDEWWHIEPSTNQPLSSAHILRALAGRRPVTVLREGLSFV